MKKKRLFLWFLIVGVFIVLLSCGYHYYAPPQLNQSYIILSKQEDTDTFHIAFIGDSWAFMHMYHNCKIARLLEDRNHHPIKVHSLGICGLTSKELYQSIFDNSHFMCFFQQRKYKLCFISAGINDTNKKMSTSYYKKSMDGIIQFMLANHIFPIILEIPDYDIQKSYERQTLSRKLIRQISMIITGTPIDCKQHFRNALNELIRENDYKNKVGVIRYKSWNYNFVKDQHQLYLNDGMHLNSKGYEVLDSIIAFHIQLRR